MDDNLHSLPRQLIELRMEHADLDDLIDRALFDLASVVWFVCIFPRPIRMAS